jgi:hypothetical protein
LKKKNVTTEKTGFDIAIVLIHSHLMFQNISPLCAEYHDTFSLEDDLMVPTFYLVKARRRARDGDLQKIETFLFWSPSPSYRLVHQPIKSRVIQIGDKIRRFGASPWRFEKGNFYFLN